MWLCSKCQTIAELPQERAGTRLCHSLVGCGPTCSCGSPFLIWFPLFSPHAATAGWVGMRQDSVPNTPCSLLTALLPELPPGIAQLQAVCLVIPVLGSQSGPSRFNTKSFRDPCSLFPHLLSYSHTSYEGSCSYPHQRTASGIHMCRGNWPGEPMSQK